jgi:NADP-reducing hydrogenase subunit HndB
MEKIKSLADLKRIRDEVQSQIKMRENSTRPEQLVQIKVGMATCGIASGAREVMNFFIDETEHLAIDAIVTQTGCMGYCYAEPTVEIILPGKEPVVFGFVNKRKAEEIIERYITQGVMIDGMIPVNYKTIDE